MPNLRALYVPQRQPDVSDAGFAALASALRAGALPSCDGAIGLSSNLGNNLGSKVNE